ncbi:hypothetical protein KU05112810_1130002 [Flavobacterium psychrophilum]|nr:hypothetical protein KU05112810_1130002 [Flavobacterium psychrophilum]
MFCNPIKVILANGDYTGEVINEVKKHFDYLINLVMSKKLVFSRFQKVDC